MLLLVGNRCMTASCNWLSPATAMNPFELALPGRVLFGCGQIAGSRGDCARVGNCRWLRAARPGARRDCSNGSPLPRFILPGIRRGGRADHDRGVRRVLDGGVDLVIGFGGGTRGQGDCSDGDQSGARSGITWEVIGAGSALRLCASTFPGGAHHRGHRARKRREMRCSRLRHTRSRSVRAPSADVTEGGYCGSRTDVWFSELTATAEMAWFRYGPTR